MAIRLVIADDHPLVLNGVENLFRLEKDFELAARCTGSAETLAAVRRHRPDVVILDIRMPGKDGLAITRELLAEKLPTRVILYTAEINEDQLLEAVRTGVGGIVLKEMAPPASGAVRPQGACGRAMDRAAHGQAVPRETAPAGGRGARNRIPAHPPGNQHPQDGGPGPS